MPLHKFAYHPFLNWHDMCDRWPPGSVTLIHSTFEVLVCLLTSVLKLAFGPCLWYLIVTISLCCVGSRVLIILCSMCCMCWCHLLLTVCCGAFHSFVYTGVHLPPLSRICSVDSASSLFPLYLNCVPYVTQSVIRRAGQLATLWVYQWVDPMVAQ